MRWEYKEYWHAPYHKEKAIDDLMKLGIDGWELVNIRQHSGYDCSYDVYVLKRPLEEIK